MKPFPPEKAQPVYYRASTFPHRLLERSGISARCRLILVAAATPYPLSPVTAPPVPPVPTATVAGILTLRATESALTRPSHKLRAVFAGAASAPRPSQRLLSIYGRGLLQPVRSICRSLVRANASKRWILRPAHGGWGWEDFIWEWARAQTILRDAGVLQCPARGARDQIHPISSRWGGASRADHRAAGLACRDAACRQFRGWMG